MGLTQFFDQNWGKLGQQELFRNRNRLNILSLNISEMLNTGQPETS